MGTCHEKENKNFEDIQSRSVKPVFGIVILVLAAMTFWKVVEWINGEPALTTKRQDELKKQIEEIEDAEQYALKAEVSGRYDCYFCPGRKIFLNAFSIWKYGVTRKGEKVRYSKDFFGKGMLRYEVQFRGDYAQCLIEEKRKLFNYPLLPENLQRPDSLKLVLPPGNLQVK